MSDLASVRVIGLAAPPPVDVWVRVAYWKSEPVPMESNEKETYEVFNGFPRDGQDNNRYDESVEQRLPVAPGSIRVLLDTKVSD